MTVEQTCALPSLKRSKNGPPHPPQSRSTTATLLFHSLCTNEHTHTHTHTHTRTHTNEKARRKLKVLKILKAENDKRGFKIRRKLGGTGSFEGSADFRCFISPISRCSSFDFDFRSWSYVLLLLLSLSSSFPFAFIWLLKFISTAV